jgi:hypothetical protein
VVSDAGPGERQEDLVRLVTQIDRDGDEAILFEIEPRYRIENPAASRANA